MEPFLGEIRIFPWSWAPDGWAFCDGSLLPVRQYAALASLLGNTYGGDGRNNFALPDLRGRTPINEGISSDAKTYPLGNSGGLENVVLSTSQMPPHNHELNALGGTPGNFSAAKSALPATVGQPAKPVGSPVNIYSAAGSGTAVAVAADTISTTGGGAGHNNMQPFLVVNFCIATSGIYPPRS
ncbi:phage tail protein [Sphingomonas sp.]|uniref:phage tail protein n=1 Tax=Sphingomonas sp. TaxID=28214 RepID=UPI003B3B6249